MSVFMEIDTELPINAVLEDFRRGNFGPVAVGPLKQAPNGWWGGVWEQGSFSIRTIDDNHRRHLTEAFHLPHTLRTVIWMTFDDMYDGQTAVYQMVAFALKEWDGDLAVLNNGDYLRVLRVSGEVRLRDDCLDPDRLVFYQDIPWKTMKVT